MNWEWWERSCNVELNESTLLLIIILNNNNNDGNNNKNSSNNNNFDRLSRHLNDIETHLD